MKMPDLGKIDDAKTIVPQIIISSLLHLELHMAEPRPSCRDCHSHITSMLNSAVMSKV
jgi:hypothetical protein